MGLLNRYLEELNKYTEETWERMYSEQYEIIKRDGKTYHIRREDKNHDEQRGIIREDV